MEPPPYDVIKLNVDIVWCESKGSLSILVRNYNVEVLGLWHNNYKYALALVSEFLTIEKTYMVSNDF